MQIFAINREAIGQKLYFVPRKRLVIGCSPKGAKPRPCSACPERQLTKFAVNFGFILDIVRVLCYTIIANNTKVLPNTFTVLLVSRASSGGIGSEHPKGCFFFFRIVCKV